MELYLLRHAIAELGKPGMPDRDRALVPEGRKKLREVLRVAKAAGMSPGMIITSPYKRTLETAKIAALILNFKEPLKPSRALMPDSSPQAVWDEIRTHKNEEQILLVGHEPLFGYLAAFLLNSSAMRLDFKKGAILRIDVSQFAAQAHGELKWYLTPKIAEGLAK